MSLMSQVAARLLARRHVLQKFAKQSNSFRTGPKSIHTLQISNSIWPWPTPRSLIDQRAVSTTTHLAVHREEFAGVQGGVQWVEDIFVRGAAASQWTIEPDLKAIKQVISESLSSQEIDSVTLLTSQGAYNRVYNVCIGEDDFIMRLALPFDPWWKMLSEVAIVQWIARNTHLPVSQILAYDASQENAIGFEWILMSELPGKQLLDDVWKTTSFSAKKKLVEEMAIYSSALFKKQLRGIGNNIQKKRR